MDASKDPDNALLDRYEDKYLVDTDLVRFLKAFIQPYTHPDINNAQYEVASIYLDTPTLESYHDHVSGVRTRYKFRIRSYNLDKNAPVFFEIKKKVGDRITKKHLKLRRSVSDKLFDKNSYNTPKEIIGSVWPKTFVSTNILSTLKPTVCVYYTRESFDSNNSDIRITFDKNLEFAVVNSVKYITDRNKLEVVKSTRNKTIMEVKYSKTPPEWVISLLHAYSLKKESFSKYVTCVQQAIKEGQL